MTRRYIYAFSALALLAMGACTKEDFTSSSHGQESSHRQDLPVVSGEVIVKFSPYVADILDKRAKTLGEGPATRSGILPVDEVLSLVGGYEVERIFPVDSRTEDRAREAGMHLWYVVRFSEEYEPADVISRLSKLGEVQEAVPVRPIQRAYSSKAVPVSIKAYSAAAADVTYPFNDRLLKDQWHLVNRGDVFGHDSSIAAPDGSKFLVGADVQVEEAWKKCTGDPSIIVAVLDEGVCLTHPDLRDNIWRNEDESAGGTDNDGNGYEGDVHGYNFIKKTGTITWDDSNDTGHGTHVAGVIAAVNNNGEGISSIAGGVPGALGVKIMSCQIFSGNLASNTLDMVKAIKYAADNGAVILQCSFGYTSGNANGYEYTPSYATEEEWAKACPLEKVALDYFIHNAGSPNGPIEGGLAIFASGNEYASLPGYPGAYESCVSVAASAGDYTPATYTNYGPGTDITAPGGDRDYYFEYMDSEHALGESGTILSTLPPHVSSEESPYGYMEGTSMACPHVSGVAALGLSYAAQQRRHFTSDEFRKLLCENVTPIDDYMTGEKVYYKYLSDQGRMWCTTLDKGSYKGQMGGQVNAAKLLSAIDGSGIEYRFPNLYIPVDGSVSVVPGNYFENGKALTYKVEIADGSVASCTENGSSFSFKGLKAGVSGAVITASDGQSYNFTITVRKTAGGNGWL